MGKRDKLLEGNAKEFERKKAGPEKLFIRPSHLPANLLIVAIALVVATAIATYFRNVKSRESAAWVTHTYQVIQMTNDFLSSVGAAEAIHQDLVLANNSSKRSAYISAITRVDTLLRYLRSEVLDNATQVFILDEKIIPFTKDQLKRWEFGLKTEPSETEKKYIFSLNDQNRKAVLDSIYLYAKKFTQNEESLLVLRNEKLKNDYLVTDIVRFSFLFLIALTCASAYLTIRQQQGDNKKLINNLEEVNVNLESKVDERTKEWLIKNKELQESIEEIQTLHQSLDVRNQRLEESLDEVQFLYDHAPCGYHTIDSSGIIIKMNKTELAWLGYTEDEIIGKMHVSKFLTKESYEQRVQDIEKLRVEGHLENMEFEFLRNDGSTFSALLNTIAYYDGQGKMIMNRSSVFDISNRKNLELKLQEANTYLLQLNEEKNRFIGMATHDLKNPINGIFGLAQLLKHYDNLNNDQLELIQHIETSVTKMTTLITKLLDLNRIEQSGEIVNEKTVNLKVLLKQIIGNFEDVAKKKKISLVLENTVGDIEFKTDPDLLEQVFDNLISNAIKFSDFDKKIWIRSRKLESGIVFEVEDQGPGIRKEEIPKLFGAFQRLSARPTGGETSTGLGLSIVKRIVQIIGGEIMVDSEVGKGTIFSLVIKKT